MGDVFQRKSEDGAKCATRWYSKRAGRRRIKGERSGGKTEEIIIILRAYHLAAIAGNLEDEAWVMFLSRKIEG